jgi:hypothetical protein
MYVCVRVRGVIYIYMIYMFCCVCTQMSYKIRACQGVRLRLRIYIYEQRVQTRDHASDEPQATCTVLSAQLPGCSQIPTGGGTRDEDYLRSRMHGDANDTSAPHHPAISSGLGVIPGSSKAHAKPVSDKPWPISIGTSSHRASSSRFFNKSRERSDQPSEYE